MVHVACQESESNSGPRVVPGEGGRDGGLTVRWRPSGESQGRAGRTALWKSLAPGAYTAGVALQDSKLVQQNDFVHSFAGSVSEFTMRRVRYAVAMSLDGYIAGPNDEADWIIMDPDIDFEALMNSFDTFLMGRRTFEAAGGSAMTGKANVVVSRTLRPQDYPNVTILNEGVEEAVSRMREEPGKDIWLFGGGELFRSLLDAGLVDTVEVAVIPVLLGEGIPLLPPPGDGVRLRLTGSRVYEKTGTVSLEYAVEAQEGAGAADPNR